MIIFGTKGRAKSVDSGEFFCPNCQQRRPYDYKEVKRYFTLYFIPLIPMGHLGEYVECGWCNMQFKSEVLQYKPKKQVSVGDVLNAMGDEVKEGRAPIEYAIRDMTQLGIDRDAATSLINGYVGEGRMKCDSCGLTYADGVTTCVECDGELVVD